MSWGRGAHKYGATRTDHAGRSFASKLEAAVFDLLKLREMAGELKVLRQQVRVSLSDAAIVYIPDFECAYAGSGDIFYVESKGFETPEWKIKKRLWRYYGTGNLEIYCGSYRAPKLTEVIIPKCKAVRK